MALVSYDCRLIAGITGALSGNVGFELRDKPRGHNPILSIRHAFPARGRDLQPVEFPPAREIRLPRPQRVERRDHGVLARVRVRFEVADALALYAEVLV